MLKNYLTVAWRNLLRYKTYSGIKILSLAIGLTACMLISLYIKDEISYDRFHQNKDLLHRVTQHIEIGQDAPRTIGATNSLMGEAFASEIPEIDQFVRITSQPAITKKENDVLAENPMFVDHNFFNVFSFPILKGDKFSPLHDINSVVISRDMEKKYFGEKNAVGENLQLKIHGGFESFKVTAVAENFPQNSTLQGGIMLPFKYFDKYNKNTGWMGGNLTTYLLLSPQANKQTVNKKMQDIFDSKTKDRIAAAKKNQNINIKITLGLQVLTAIHLDETIENSAGSSPVYSWILGSIAVFILLIGCINFINLAIAQSLKRSKEIGIRKVAGSTRMQLIGQFLSESFLVSFIAFVFAIGLTLALLPFFNELSNKKLSISYISGWQLYAAFIVLLILTSFIAGFYPSLVLSAFRPAKVLKSAQKLVGKNYFTKSLIVVQFSLAICLVTGTTIMNSQLSFLLNAHPGYDSRNLIQVDLPLNKNRDQLTTLFKEELNDHAGIVSVAAMSGGRMITGVHANNKTVEVGYNKIDHNFIPTFGIKMVAGRNFSPAHPSDSFHAIIVNESFVQEAGWKPAEAIGRQVTGMEGSSQPFAIAGVIKDIHFSSLKEKIIPELYTMDTVINYGQVWVKINDGNIPQTLSRLQDAFNKLVPYYPYSYQFKEDINARNYEAEARWKKIITIASVLFAFISCIGLFGLVMLSVEQRAKEIGIRKVLGAAVTTIVVLITREFIILVAVAFVFALPVAWYFINQWLQQFPYRTALEWWMFVLPVVLIMATALITMSFRSIKAAITNPARSLRAE